MNSMANRNNLLRVIDEMVPPDASSRRDALSNRGSIEAHNVYMQQWQCLNGIEYLAPESSLVATDNLIVAAWNLERCKHVEQSAQRIRDIDADVVLATEMDYGMARSGQRHTTRDLAAELGFGYAFGVEFVELGLGDPRECRDHKGTHNQHGLHGNAILSRLPLDDISIIPLDEGGSWFERSPKNDDQYRVGGRMGIAARINIDGNNLTLASVHFESESDAGGRAYQTRKLLSSLETLYGDGACVIGGDLNTRAFHDSKVESSDMMINPFMTEPCFKWFVDSGYQWKGANTGKFTTRLHPEDNPDKPLKTLDWLFTRGVTAERPFVVPAVTPAGNYLSDHELIGASVRFCE